MKATRIPVVAPALTLELSADEAEMLLHLAGCLYPGQVKEWLSEDGKTIPVPSRVVDGMSRFTIDLFRTLEAQL